MKKIPNTRLFGQRIDRVHLDTVLHDIESTIMSRGKYLYLAMNIHIFLELYNDREAKKQFENARIIYSDGVPFVWLSRWFPRSLPARVSGTELVDSLLRKKDSRIFIIGGTPSIIAKLRQKYCDTIVGFSVPPFGEAWDYSVDAEILAAVQSAQPNIILVAVGALRQERWLWRYFQQTPAHAGLGVGSALEILAGEKPRAPRWMQRLALEWLWRVWLEPRRLWKRYVRDAYRFLFVIFRFFIFSRRRKQ